MRENDERESVTFGCILRIEEINGNFPIRTVALKLFDPVLIDQDGTALLYSVRAVNRESRVVREDE